MASLPGLPTGLLNTTVSLRSYQGATAYGPSYGPTTTAKCYWEDGFRRITNAQGQEVTASALAIFKAGTSIAAGDELMLDGRRYEVAEVQTQRPGGSVHHIEAYLVSAAS